MRDLVKSLGVLVVALTAWPALAATIVVTKPTDNPTAPDAGSLRDALGKAQPGDVVQIQAGVTVKLKGDLTSSTANVTIEGQNPTDGQSGKPSTIGADDPKASPAPTLIVNGGGSVVKNVKFDGVPVTVGQNNEGSKITGCEFDGANSGVTIDHATDTIVGTTPADVNGANGQTCTFNGCKVGVASNTSAGTIVAHDVFKKTGVGVKSTDDTNITVSDNTIDAKAPDKSSTGDGAVFNGSSGSCNDNTITPDKKGGTGIIAGPSSDGTVRGQLQGKNNNVKTSGKANGIDVKNHKNATISDCDVEGKTKGFGVHCSIGPDGGAGVCEIRDCNATGCAVGFAFDCDGSTGATCTVADCKADKCGKGFVCGLDGSTGATCTLSDDTATHCAGPGFSCDATGADGATSEISNCHASDCKVDGIECRAGPNGTCTLHDDDCTRCGSGPEACGMKLGGSGGALSAKFIDVEQSKGAGVLLVNTGASMPTVCSFENLTVALSKTDGFVANAQTSATVLSPTFTNNHGAMVFIDQRSTIGFEKTFLDGEASVELRSPLIDVEPRGWNETAGPVTSLIHAEFDDAGNLTVAVTAGDAYFFDVVGAGGAMVEQSANPPQPSYTFPAAQVPAGDFMAVSAFGKTDPASPTSLIVPLGETRLKRPKQSAAAGVFVFSKTSFTITSAPNADGAATFTITNSTDGPLTLDIGKLTGNFSNSPFGQVPFLAHETRDCFVGHSAMAPITETAHFQAKLPDGTVEANITVKGVVK
jgi:hypothetical protein